eukprot:scaffold10232_cov75-Phaeocystis_antarctica.AAC.5
MAQHPLAAIQPKREDAPSAVETGRVHTHVATAEAVQVAPRAHTHAVVACAAAAREARRRHTPWGRLRGRLRGHLLGGHAHRGGYEAAARLVAQPQPAILVLAPCVQLAVRTHCEGVGIARTAVAHLGQRLDEPWQQLVLPHTVAEGTAFAPPPAVEPPAREQQAVTRPARHGLHAQTRRDVPRQLGALAVVRAGCG